MHEPLVSIVIVNKNGKKFLEGCLSSVFNSDYKNIEVLLVDCLSTDGSQEFVRKNYPKVKLITPNEDKGYGWANNLAAKQAKGKYILLLNNDVILEKNTISKLVDCISTNEGVISGVEFNTLGGFATAGWTFRPINTLYTLFKDFIKVNPSGPFYLNEACTIISRDLFLKYPLNELFFLYEDLEWSWRLRLFGIQLNVCEEAIYFHYGSATVNTVSERQFKLVLRCHILSFFICFKLITQFFLLPLFFLLFIRLAQQSPTITLKAILNELCLLPKEIINACQSRKFVQSHRVVGDIEILKKMWEGAAFQEMMKKKYQNVRLKSPWSK